MFNPGGYPSQAQVWSPGVNVQLLYNAKRSIVPVAFTAAAGQTVFRLDSQGLNVLGFVPGTNSIQVFVNGAYKALGLQWIEIDEFTFQLLQPAALNDIVVAVLYVQVTSPIPSQELSDAEEAAIEAALEAVEMRNETLVLRNQTQAIYTQITDITNRTIRIPQTDNIIPPLPDAATRANKLIAFDAQGNPSVTVPEAQSAAAVLIQLAADGAPAIGLQDQGMTLESYITTELPRVVSSVAQMKLMSTVANKVFQLLGYYTPGDGGGGLCYVKAGDTTTADNGGAVFVATDGGRIFRDRTKPLTLRQFGARDGMESAPAIRRAILWAQEIDACLEDHGGTYLWSENISSAHSFHGVNIHCSGASQTIFDGQNMPAGQSMLTIVGGSGGTFLPRVENAWFKGDTARTCALIEFCGTNMQKFVRCRFNRANIAALFHNRDPGSFTEYCVLEHCDISTDVNIAKHYRVTLGDRSFNGSGIWEGTINTDNDYAVLISPGAYPYNSPFSPSIWTHKPGQSVIRNEGWFNSAFFGQIKYEGFVNGVFWGDISAGATSFTHVGSIQGISNTFLGLMSLCHSAFSLGPSSGNIEFRYYHPIKVTQKLVPGANLIAGVASGPQGLNLIKCSVAGPNYEDRATLTIEGQGYGGDGTVAKLLQGFQINVAGLPAMPVYSVQGGGGLVITMPAFTGLDIYATVLFADFNALQQRPA